MKQTELTVRMLDDSRNASSLESLDPRVFRVSGQHRGWGFGGKGGGWFHGWADSCVRAAV